MLVVVRLTLQLAAKQPLAVIAESLDQLSTETDELLRLLDYQPLERNLPRLRDDFKLVCQGVRILMVHSDRDRPDLARALVMSQVTFRYRMMVLQFHVARSRLRMFSPSRP
jgi:hypothetical protein